ncbi:MAG: tetratricopeptide repeat protein [Puia sp.]|nr:tetratricopeptide repeat protein [Puia sp.]
MKNIRFSLLVAVVFLGNVVSAQTLEQGKKFLYYQRYASAKDALTKVVAANPNNIEAIYWLGQTLLVMKDSAGATDVYQKAITSNGTAPLLLAGMGEIELREGKNADARAHFDQAINLTKGKDVNVLNAVALANVDAKAGDPAYAIEKLNQATQVKNFKSPETYIIMGDAYRKQIDGGGAVTSYQKALTVDPQYAQAKYKIGLIYLTQNNKEYFLPAFEDALQLDPNYAPAYYALYQYWFYRDINKAKDYYNKYLAVADQSASNDYDRASIKFASHDNDGAIADSKAALSTLGDKADPRYYKLIAYSYDAKGDSVNAKSYLDQYFAKQKPEDFLPMDYAFLGSLQAKIPGSDSTAAFKSYQTAIDKDTALDDKTKLLKEASDLAKKVKNKTYAALFAGETYSLNKNPTNTDLYNWGQANYQAGNYKTADSIFCGVYIPKYPNEIFGYLWCARSKRAQDDSVNSAGLAIEAYAKLSEVARALDSTAKVANGPDSIKYRAQAREGYFILASYYNDVKKDKPTAIYYLEQVIAVDPNNAVAPKYIEILKKPAAPARKPGTTGGAKPAAK